jgi:hypothetical protein
MYYCETAKGWAPWTSEDRYLRWSIPSQCWSKQEYGEDTIKITVDMTDNEWWGVTEMDQCVHRDLEEDEVLHIREELGLNNWLRQNHPELLENQAPKP